MFISPAVSIRGALEVPGDKSISHRALLLGAIADGETAITGFGGSADTLATADALRQLGVEIEVDGHRVNIDGAGLRGLVEPDEAIDCGNAGTLMRLLAGILAGQDGHFVLTGDESLSRRPLERIAEPLSQMGARIKTTDGHAPLTIAGGRLDPIRYELPVASAQVKSCILLAGLYASSGPTVVVEPVPTRDHTERLLEAAGARIARRPREAASGRPTRLQPLTIEIPGISPRPPPSSRRPRFCRTRAGRSAGSVSNPTRTGFLSVLERMGARIAIFNRRLQGGEPVADLEVGHAELDATEVPPEEVPLLVDELRSSLSSPAWLTGRASCGGRGNCASKSRTVSRVSRKRYEGLESGSRRCRMGSGFVAYPPAPGAGA